MEAISVIKTRALPADFTHKVLIGLMWHNGHRANCMLFASAFRYISGGCGCNGLLKIHFSAARHNLLGFIMTSSNGNIFYATFVKEIHKWPVHIGQWRGALIFSLLCAWTNGWANNRDAGDLRRHRAYYDVTVMKRLLKLLKRCLFVSRLSIFLALQNYVLMFS